MERSLDTLNRVTGGGFTHCSALVTDLGQKSIVCESHGEYTAAGMMYFGKREVWSVCPDCKEAEQAKERMEKAQQAAAQKVAQLVAMIDEASIPARFVGRSFENFKTNLEPQMAALKVTKAYAEDFNAHLKAGTGLILSGQPGTGKSHLAAAILQSIMPQHCGLYITCMGLIRTVRNTWRKDSEESETAVLRTFGTVPLLVLDEIGVQYGTDGEQTIIFDVLDRRYREMMPTILLTNQAKQGFKEFIGERSFDRLVETSRWVAFDWESYRSTARREAA